MQGGHSDIPGARAAVTGPGSAAVKYDILTALLVTAARGAPAEARLALRLALLVTARFNWRRGSFAVGLREMARMWGVTERTAKREVARMRAMGWIAVRVPAARGRVAEHGIDLGAVLAATRAHWEAVGPDFVERMSAAPATEPAGNVVPLRPGGEAALPEEDGTGWAAAAARLRAADPSLYGAWFARLRAVDLEGGVLSLAAPSQFIAAYVETHHRARLMAALAAEAAGVREVRVTGPDG